MKLPSVLLLSGGQSTRFWPFTNKNATPFLGKPLLYWHYDQLVRLGFSQVFVVANIENREVLETIEKPKKLDVIFLTQKGKGQAACIMSADQSIPDGELFILNASDIYTDSQLQKLLAERKKKDGAILLGAIEVDSYFPGGYLKIKSDGTVEKIIEKPIPAAVPGRIVRIVADIFPSKKLLFTIIKKHCKNAASGYEETVNAIIAKGTPCYPIISHDPWMTLKYPWHILPVMDASLGNIVGSHIGKNVTIAKSAVIEGPVVIEDNVKIFECVKIMGPTYIGKNSIIGNNSMIRKSHIGESVVVGFNTDITRSYVGNNTWFHSNYVGDSVLGENVSMGSGTVLANLRLDESNIISVVNEEKLNTNRNKLGAMIGDNVRIGVNSSIMPGVKIGSNSFVGAGVILSEDLKEGSYVHISTQVVIAKNTKTVAKTRDEFRKKI